MLTKVDIINNGFLTDTKILSFFKLKILVSCLMKLKIHVIAFQMLSA